MTGDFRDAVFLAVREVMQRDPRVVILYNDMGALELDRLRVDYPSRVVNVGISEQNMASLAAGLALSGRRVFIYGIIAHVFARSYEQIRNDICCANLPVGILGVGSGLSYGADGPTHHGVQDVAVMRSLPNLVIYNPSDCVTARAAVRLIAAGTAPGYVRMDKEQVPPIHDEGADFTAGLAVVREGVDAALVSTGVLVHRALQVAERLGAEGLRVRVIDLFRLKPVDFAAVRSAISGVRAVVTLEENSPAGGLASIVAEALTRGSEHPAFAGISLADDPLVGSASRPWAEAKFGQTEEAVAETVRGALGGAARG